MERFHADPVLEQLKDFQQASVDHAFAQLYEHGASRFLVADEVGLGKTMVARGVIARAIEHLWDEVPRIDVIYICSNSSIAQQNIRRLNVIPDQGFSFSSRMTMIAREVARLEGNKVNFVSFTPGTSFSLKSSTGMGDERVLLYWLLDNLWSDGLMNANGSKELLRCGIDKRNWQGRLDTGRLERNAIDERLLLAFGDDVVELNARESFERLRHHYATGTADRSIRQERDALIGALRQRLARRCVSSLEPDLVILDEFQRFRSLMDRDDPAGSLASDLFDHGENKTLLLSATPYKMYTGSDDEEDDHHRDFTETIRFLFDGRANRFDESMATYRSAVLDVEHRTPQELRSARIGVENELKKVMVRTERLGAGDDRNGMLTEVTPRAQLTSDDVKSYVALERLGQTIGAQAMLPYWKSVPSFLNFSEGYQADRRLTEALTDPTRQDVRRLAERTTRIDWDKWERYEAVNTGNAQLGVLQEQVIDNGAWQMLWLAPSLPYHRLEGPWAGERSTFTKRLIFSSYVGVPRSVSSLISYEAERRMFGLRPDRIDNSVAGRRNARGLLPFRRDLAGRPGSMNSFSFIYGSPFLVELGDPLAIAREHGTDLGAREIRAIVEQRAADALAELDHPVDSEHQGDDTRWYWAAPLLLDAAAGVSIEMGHKRIYRNAWLGGSDNTDDDEEHGGRSHDLFIEHLELAKETYRGNVPLGRMPADLPSVVADLSLGAPGTVALRSLQRIFGDDASPWLLWYYSGRISWAMRSLMNLPDVSSMIRAANWDQEFWRTALRYCADGCLTAVLDEFFHVLRDSLGLFTIDNLDRALTEFTNAVSEAISTKAAPLVANDHLGENGQTQHRFRTRYAMRFGAAKSETEQSTATATNVRRSFNSPFWPFVLTSISIGQEGLDFHLYCHAIMHWNLPSNPVDLEQREGRVHRFKGHAIRRNLAAAQEPAALNAEGDPWEAMFDAAVAERNDEENELMPFWIYPGEAKIERHVPLLPLSQEVARLAKLKRDVARYRLVFGQPRQDDLLEFLGDLPPDKAAELRIDLSAKGLPGSGQARESSS